MKRLICILLTLALLLGAAGGTAEAAPEQAGGNRIPGIGEVISGFETKEIRDFPIAGGQLVLFEHQKTGAQALWIANEDTNRIFQIAFRTRPADDMGLPHVFEHATLFGSEKYPSSSLFFNIKFQTYNSFLNAFTMDAATAYPIGSLSEAQLLRLADYYVDSCFHPMIMTDESIFRTQAWHYRLPDAESELSYEGVVYSEMTGAMTLEKTALVHANRATFPGAAISYSYDGLPEAIPEMTWEDVKSFHNLYYHPSNSFTILYGQLDGPEAFLKLLDDEFSQYERKDFPQADAGYTPITGPTEAKYAYPTAEGSDPANQSMVIYSLILPGMKGNTAQETLIDHLCMMMNQPGSALQNLMKKRFPAARVTCGREIAAPDDAVVFSAAGLNENDGEAFRALVDEAIADAAENGFTAEMADILMASERMKAKLIPESGDPVGTYVTSFLYNCAVTGNPFAYQERTEALNRIGEENESGALREAAARWLKGSGLYTLITTYPAPGEKEKQDAALKEKLAGIKAGMSEAEIQAIIAESNAEPAAGDAGDLIAGLRAVGVKELPEEVRQYEVSDTTDEHGIRFIEAEAAVDGIGQTTLLLDAQALPQEDLHWARLFAGLLGELETDAHTKEELDTLIARYLYGRSATLTTPDLADSTLHPYLGLQWIAMDEDLARGYELTEELVFHTRFTDTARLAELISAQKTAVRSTISSGSYQIMLYRGLADRYPLYRFTEYVNFVEYYSFLEELEKQAAENPEAVAEKLRRIQQFFANRFGAAVLYAGSREGIEANRAAAGAFLSGLESEERTPAVYELPVPAAREALIVDGNIQFNNVVATLDDLGMEEFDYGLAAVCAMTADRILMPVLRDQMGVYTPMNAVVAEKGMYLISYRDPGVRETFDVYATLGDRIEQMELDQETLDGYIMSVYSNLARPTGELSGAAQAVSGQLSGTDPELKLRCMRQLKQVTPETVKAAAGYYRSAWEKGVHSTSGSAAAIGANADLYDAVLNPFGAQDVSAVELTDLTEDHPAYGAGRFMFENGLMPPKEEGLFMPDAEAEAGDAAAALFAALGMGSADDRAGAWEGLSAFGLFPEGTTAETPLTWGMYDQVMAGLGALAGQSLPQAATEENRETPMTRGELAMTLAPVFGYGME